MDPVVQERLRMQEVVRMQERVGKAPWVPWFGGRSYSFHHPHPPCTMGQRLDRGQFSRPEMQARHLDPMGGLLR